MKVLHMISSGGMYGAEAVILNLARAFRSGPHDCVLGVFLNSSDPNLQLHERAVKEGFESHPILCKGRIDRAAVASIRRLATLTGADLIHAHGYKADLYVHLALRGLRMPLVSTCHTWYDTDWRASLYGRVDRFVLQKYTRIVAVSEEVKQRLLQARVPAEKVRLIRNGIDLSPFDAALASRRADQAPESGLLVGLVGRLAWEKGIDLFLRAAAKVLVQVPNARFVVAGEGPDREKLEQLIDDLKIRASVELLGHRDAMAPLYASLDVMVVSSRQEGLPIALLEGMASGLALVATAVGEVPSVVVDGRTGVLVPAEDVNRMAAAIVELLRNPKLRNRLGESARRLIEEKHSAARMAEDYLRVYEEAIAAANREREARATSPAASQGGAQ